MKIEKTYIFPYIMLIISILDYVGFKNQEGQTYIN